MKILITGPNSFSGRVVLQYLLDKGHDIVTISRSGLKYVDVNHVTCIHGDLNEITKLPHDIDAVVHIAATSTSNGVTAATLTQDNIQATLNLVKLLNDTNVKTFVFFSTLSVYGEIEQDVVTETTPITNPCSYGASKLMAEAILREQKQFKTLAIRLPAVIGRDAARHWLANTIIKAKNSIDITIFNPTAVFNNAVHIESLATLIESVLNNGLEQNFDYINVASTGGIQIRDVLTKITNKCNSNSNVIVGNSAKKAFSISCLKAVEKYQFQPLDFEVALDLYLAQS